MSKRQRDHDPSASDEVAGSSPASSSRRRTSSSVTAAAAASAYPTDTPTGPVSPAAAAPGAASATGAANPAARTSGDPARLTEYEAALTYTDTVRRAGFDPAHPEDFEADKPTDRAVLIGLGGRWLTDWALRLAIVIMACWLLSKIIGYLWVGILPILLALILSTVLWPPVKYMRKIKVPWSLAALLSILLAFGLVAGIIAAITPSIVDQAPRLFDSASKGIREIQDWIQGPPLNVQDEQMNSAINELTSVLQTRGDEIANGVLTGVSAFSSILVTLVLTIVLTFFFIKDGVKFLPWLRRIVGRNAGRHLTEVLTRSWVTLSAFIRTQAIVSFVDAFFIGLGLMILGVPLAWALAIITFLAGFIPIVGAFTAGALAVLVALVSNGLTTALIVLVLVIAVQQLEGNVLQPVLQSRSMNLHPVVVLLGVAAGGGLFGIIGAFLAVPVAAVVAVVLRYLGEQIDLRTGDRSAAEVNAATEEGKLTAWLGELGSSRFRKVPGLSGLAAAVSGDAPDHDSGTHRHHTEHPVAEPASAPEVSPLDDDTSGTAPESAGTVATETDGGSAGTPSSSGGRLQAIFGRVRAALRSK